MYATLKDQIIILALQEDIGHGDITTDSITPAGLQAEGKIQAQEDLVLCGLEVAERVFHLLDPSARFRAMACDGERVQAGKVVAEVTGSARALLTAERTALNFLQRLSGIATQVSSYVTLLLGTGARLVDTRKTTPGHRDLEKYAVRCAGAQNHRFGLSDGILIKDNHLKIAGGIERAVTLARKCAPHLFKIEVEVDSLDQIAECLAAGVDCILLDNMSLDHLREGVKLINRRCLTEASGGIQKERLPEIGRTGVDFISVGALTHSVRSADLNMEIG
ncbi:MAG: carboxylating nicotinate-nucleotide diphosphorylase [bacterium]